ncbi:MAG TPA: lysylphosphatidylglycerol synthase transmembrane domain-containing protein [Gemmatimonadaceae bacterium]|nr:lysylphosphatidylglycerol synthase transmembrane domain-containing protein [Gemmatimonadaceae bacterium]
MTFKRWLAVFLSFGAAIGISLYIVVSSWPRRGGTVALPPLAHGLALAAVLLEIGTRATKIKLSAASLHIPLRFGTSLRTCLGGDFGAAITPARSGAEPARFFILAQAGVGAANALLILFTELFLEMLSLGVLAAVLAVAFQGSGPMVAALITLVGSYAAVVLGAGAVGWMLAQRSASGPPPPWARSIGFHAGRWRVVPRALRQIRTSVGGLRQANVPVMTGALLFSVLHVLLRLTILPAIVLSLDPKVPLSPLVLWPLALMYGFAVAPAPGGGGVVEVMFRVGLGDVIPAAYFGSALIWWRVYTFYLYIVLGALAAGNTVLRALREDSTEPPLAVGEAVVAEPR